MRKKITTMACMALLLLGACGDNAQENKTAPEAETEVKAEDPSSNPDYKKGLALVAQSDCLTCHAVSTKITGPAYSEVATKYANADDATITKLAQTIIKGGVGNWGEVQMIAHPDISEDDAKAMVKYILLIK